MMPVRIAVVPLGGTIDSLGRSRTDLALYTESRQRLPEGEMLAQLPELGDVAEVEPIEFPRSPSHAIDAARWLELARLVQELVDRPDVDGVVVTHGTNTIEETAYLLHLLVRPRRPVVLVGAMRPWNTLGTDGPLNLLRAVQVAADPAARDLGVVIAMDGVILSPRDATKGDTFRLDAFSTSGATLGTVEADGRVVIARRPLVGLPGGSFASVRAQADLPRVGLLLSHVGADGVLVDALVDAGARGIVSAGTGPGSPTPLEEAALDRAIARGVVVCQASRVPAGPVPSRGSFVQRGIVSAGSLAPWKARILLSLALAGGDGVDAVRAWFARA